MRVCVCILSCLTVCYNDTREKLRPFVFPARSFSVNMIHRNQEQNILLFVLAAQKTLLLSDEAAHFLCWQRCRSPSSDPPPTAPQQSLPVCSAVYLFFLSKDVCGFRSSGQSLVLLLRAADLCGTRAPTEEILKRGRPIGCQQ